jgi:hypothetical protein
MAGGAAHLCSKNHSSACRIAPGPSQQARLGLIAGSDEWVTIATGISAIRAIGVRSEAELNSERKMIKIVFCLRRLSRLTHEEFLRYWYETHAPFVRKHQQLLRIVRYVQHPDGYVGSFVHGTKSFEVLCHLVRNAGRVVGKDELFEGIWPHAHVTEDSLTRCISKVRTALGDTD